MAKATTDLNIAAGFCSGGYKLDFAHSRCMADGVCDTEEAVGWDFLLVWGISRP